MTTLDDDGQPVNNPSIPSHEELFAADAVVARQKHIIALLNGIRHLMAAIIILFLVFGIVGSALLRSSNATRDTTERLRREQHVALCDIYIRLERPSPEEMNC